VWGEFFNVTIGRAAWEACRVGAEERKVGESKVEVKV
jgi:hypothetical protein